MKRKVDVVLIDEALEEFKKLNSVVREQTKRGVENSEEIQLLKAIKQKKELIAQNPAYGDKIPKKLYPKEIVHKYNPDNLWRVELTNYWRMLYTLKGDRVEVICFILYIVGHKRYNKLFGYKKK